ncbi:MAG: BspA family leucine-rich repeat surface protein [Spirochaetota bacterium]
MEPKKVWLGGWLLPLLFLLGCELTPGNQQESNSAPSLVLGASHSPSGSWDFRVVSWVEGEQTIVEHGKVQMPRYWQGVNVRWGLRQKDATGKSAITWLQSNENNSDEKSQYPLKADEAHKHEWTLYEQPQDPGKWEVVASVQAPNRTERQAYTGFPPASEQSGLSKSLGFGSPFAGLKELFSELAKPAPSLPHSLRYDVSYNYNFQSRWVRSFQVTWTEPKDTSAILGYELAYGATTEPWSDPVFASGTSYTIPHRKLSAPGTRFEVRLRSVGKNGMRSHWLLMPPYEILRDIRPPLVPASVRYRLEGGRAQLNWSRPNGGGPIRQYEVSYGATTAPWSAPVLVSGTSYTIRELPAPGTMFEVRLRSVGTNNFYSGWVRKAPLLVKTTPRTKAELQSLVDAAIAQNPTVNLNFIDTSLITDMSYLFRGVDKKNFNGDISEWDTSNVTTMEGMFGFAFQFNRDIRAWDVSSVTRMDKMFWQAAKFNQDISAWDTSNVTNMDYMFTGARDFEQNLRSWNVAKVANKPPADMFWGSGMEKHPAWQPKGFVK